MRESGFRAMSPRFQGENLEHNLKLVEKLRAVATDIGCSVAQVAIAWVAAQGADVIPLVGARQRQRLTEALGALELKLTPAQLRSLSDAVPPEAVAGSRYAAAQMAHLDSEQGAHRL
jgi:aryl-alcohol dehydrogenase-like predicted oxidoreductase